MSLGGNNYGEGARPQCPNQPEGKHDDDEERMYGHTGDGKPAHGRTLTCKRCGNREFIVIY
ncbi:MAG TPA: hypothetical protein VI893_01350 [Thermoplasmata archaeon]|nr:hypothetical protein [Thermoplasmata archaeon]